VADLFTKTAGFEHVDTSLAWVTKCATFRKPLAAAANQDAPSATAAEATGAPAAAEDSTILP
jgi:hypothetical protein